MSPKPISPKPVSPQQIDPEIEKKRKKEEKKRLKKEKKVIPKVLIRYIQNRLKKGMFQNAVENVVFLSYSG